MNIREAAPGDSDELQELQAKCPQGTNLIVTTVNRPDFLARVKAYESYKVFVACEHDRIVGSAACAIRDGLVGGDFHRLGFEFQYFTDPEYRRRGVARVLHQQIEDYLAGEGAALSYLTVMEGNVASMRLFESQGFELHRTLVMPGLAVYQEMDVASLGQVRNAAPADLPAVGELLNETWEGYDLYQPTSAESLTRFVERTPHYGFDNLLVLEDEGQIVACLGFWDWSKITQITVLVLSRKMRITGFLLKLMGYLRPMPPFIKPGDELKQLVLTPLGFRAPGFLGVLVRHLNNQALAWGIQQIFCVCEQDHPLLNSMKGFIRVDAAQHLYVKPLREGLVMGDGTVFVDGVDL